MIVDYNNNRLRRLDDDGVLRGVAGTGQHGYAPDGVPALDCPLENPIDAAIAPDGTTFVMEQHGARVLRVDPAGLLTVYAGSVDNPGYEAYEGDGGPAREAFLSQASGLALGDDGTVYVADTTNHVIREVRTDGTIWTLAGDGEQGLVDGAGAEARFAQPYAMAYADGALYVVERLNHTVRRVDVATGEVTTVAGTGQPGLEGDGGPAVEAELDGPLGVTVGPDGGIYVADSENHAIRRIDLDDGTIGTVVGVLGEKGDLEDGALPLEAHLDWPNDVAFDQDGALLVVDTLHDVVRRIEGFTR